MNNEFLKGKILETIYFKRKKPKGILHAHFTFNTSRLTLTDLEGNVLFWLTPSRCGYKGNKRKTAFAIKTTITEMAKEMVELGFNLVEVRVSGVRRVGRRTLVRLMRKEKIKMTSIQDVTPVPFNGTRLRRRRRR
jgi:small subunit ribosomal protein S11